MQEALKITSKTTKKQLIEHAKENLGVELNPEDGRDDLIKAVQDAEKSLGITPQKGGENSKDTDTGDEDKQAKEESKKPKNPRAAVIEVHAPPSANPDPEDDNEEETHCIVGFNGKNFQIQYETEVKVPWGVYDILCNAVNTRYRKEKVKGHDKKVLVPYQRKRYNVTLIEKIY